MAAPAPAGMQWTKRGDFDELTYTDDSYKDGFAPAGTLAGSGSYNPTPQQKQLLTNAGGLNLAGMDNSNWTSGGAAPAAPSGFGIVGGAIKPSAGFNLASMAGPSTAQSVPYTTDVSGAANAFSGVQGGAPSPAPQPAQPTAAPSQFGGVQTGATPSPAPAPGATPAPAPIAPNILSALKGLDWSTGNEANATKQALQIANQNGWTIEQLSAAMPWTTTEQIRTFVAKYAPNHPYNQTATTSSGYNLSAQARPTFGQPGVRGPTDWKVDANQTVASQIENLIKSDSPLMQRARAKAMQEANARGLSNTSMAGTAGEAAVIDAALPIAQQDASTYGKSAEFKATGANTFNRDFNQFEREMSMADYNLSANDWAADRAMGRGETQADRQLERELRLQQERSKTDSGSQASTLERGYINALNQARTDYSEKLAAISMSKDMDSDLKKETLANLKASYNTMIGNYAEKLGWDKNSWLIDTAGDPAAAPPPAANTPSATQDWSARNTTTGQTLIQEYDRYKAEGGTMSKDQWLLSRQSSDYTGSGAGIGSGGIAGGTGSNGVASGDW